MNNSVKKFVINGLESQNLKLFNRRLALLLDETYMDLLAEGIPVSASIADYDNLRSYLNYADDITSIEIVDVTPFDVQFKVFYNKTRWFTTQEDADWFVQHDGSAYRNDAYMDVMNELLPGYEFVGIVSQTKTTIRPIESVEKFLSIKRV